MAEKHHPTSFKVSIFFLVLVHFALVNCVSNQHVGSYLIRVERGDTLAALAAKYDTTAKDIIRTNHLERNSPLNVGQKLTIYPGPSGFAAGHSLTLDVARDRDPNNHRAKFLHRAQAPAADPREFNEEDFPQINGEKPDRSNSETRPKDQQEKKGRGLFFGGYNDHNSQDQVLDWPTDGPVSSRFGMRHGKLHNGVDIQAVQGAEVHSAGAGKVVFAARNGRYGKLIIVQHKNSRTFYAHLSAINVRVGQIVNHQVVIGRVGATGNATGAHLHFEVRNANNRAIDPIVAINQSSSRRLVARQSTGQIRVQ